MAKTVFILGAGASAMAGAPLMATFLDVAHELWQRGKVNDSVDSFRAVFDGIDQLQQVHSKAQLDIQNLEAVFAAFEMARTLGGFAQYGPEDADRLVASMKLMIVKTLEQTVRLTVGNQGRSVLPPRPYGQFGELVAKLRSSQPRHDVAILTFNYDLGVDYGLHKANVAVDYGLGQPDGSDRVPLLKLHGSLNWAKCSKCSVVVPWHLREYFSKFSWQQLYDVRDVTMPIGSQLTHLQHCSKPVLAEPVLVPPTWNKTEYHRAIGEVWVRAARELRQADSIIVSGFSLLPSDAFFDYLYALGTAGSAPLRRFWVFDPDPSDVVEARFRRLLGPGAEQRFKYHRETFEQAISSVRGALLQG